MLNEDPEVWRGAYKIPWQDPDFSRRMLTEHLAQTHDLASRRSEWIFRQVEWLHRQVLGSQKARILDLGCGPGLYSHRLARLGHECRGIDFGPAAIAYARQNAPVGASCEFVQGDIRQTALGGPYDLALLLYGELNVFAPSEMRDLLARARACLAPGGRLLIEMQTTDAIERVGHGEPSETVYPSGLFSDRSHRLRIENRWLNELRVTVQTFLVTELPDGPCREYRNTTQALTDCELSDLLVNAGFDPPIHCPEWPENSGALKLWSAKI